VRWNKADIGVCYLFVVNLFIYLSMICFKKKNILIESQVVVLKS